MTDGGEHGGEFVHIGCYTGDGGERGEGIVVARRDPATGALDVLGTAAATPSPSFLAWHPTLPVLYAVNEVDDGAVSAWVATPDGELRALGTWSTGGALPCHLAVAADGSHLFTANYGGGSVCVHPLDSAGQPGERSDLLTHEGHGADPRRQDRPHVHMVSPDPGDGPLLAVDLGTDTVYRYDLDAASGRLLPHYPQVHTRPGTGPRHLARHPDGGRLYLAGELDAMVTVYQQDAEGALRECGRVPASGRDGHVQPSGIVVGPDGRFLYVGNRGVDTVAVFALDQPVPRYLTEVPAGGEWPRHLELVGRHLYVAGERSHQVAVFAVDPLTGLPEAAGPAVDVPSPTCVLAAPDVLTSENYQR